MECQSLTVTDPILPGESSDGQADCCGFDNRRRSTDELCTAQHQAVLVKTGDSFRLYNHADSQSDSGTAVHRQSTNAGAHKLALVTTDSNGEHECSTKAAESPQTDATAAANHDRAKEWFLRCGMTKDAWNAWCKMHINPVVAIAHYYSSEIGLHVLSMYMITGMHFENSLDFWLVTLPLMIFVLVFLVTDIGFWRCGPDFVNMNVYPLLMLTATMTILPVLYVGYLGPISAVPWNNRVLFMCVNAAAIWMSAQASMAGKVKGDHPAEPRTSILKPVLQCTVNSMLLWDALTDLSVFKSLMRQKSNGCWWFGEAGRGGAWNWLIASFGTFAALDLVAVLYILVSGSESESGVSRRARQRVVLVTQIICTLSEIGIVCGTLLHLFSLQSTRKTIGDVVGDTDIGTELALSFVSLFSALIGVTVLLVGTSKASQALSATCDRMSQAINLSSQDHRRDRIVSDLPELKSGSVVPEFTRTLR